METAFNTALALNTLLGENRIKGKSINGLAEHCGVGRHSVSRWNNGRGVIPQKHWDNICEYFGVTTKDFFEKGLSDD